MSPAPPYASDDPWNTAPRHAANGASVTLGSGLPSGWWKRQDRATVNVIGQQGFILRRYTVYEVVTEVSGVYCEDMGVDFDFVVRKAGPCRGGIRSLCFCGIVW